VSSPIPVRGLPYKVVCFLGLNNDVFPRKDIFMGFDLLGEKYLVGDRNKKETDKYLFLDTILAARDKLYLSYIGQSAKDNTEIPPSIVVDTFLDYISQEKFVVMHPLHGFSSKYQKDDKRLFTYLYAEQGNGFNPKAMKPEELTEVSVYTFVKFFEHPIEWYFKNILGIKYEEKEETLSETELFELDPLQKWIIKNNLLRVDKRDVESYLQKGIKEGVLPLKNLGRVTLDNLIEETSAIRLKYQSLTCGIEEQNIAIDLIIDNIQFTGTIDGVFNRQYIACSFSKSSEKNMVRAYLKTLLLCANDEIASAFLINADGESTNLSVFSSDEAKSKIKTLLVYFRKGMTSPLKFTLKATKPPQNAVLSITSVVNSFKEDADGNYVFDPNKYMQNLVLEGYFDDFNETDFAELKTLAELLNLKTV
jgi:exodeoxyribonuclease V gamma subunit